MTEPMPIETAPKDEACSACGEEEYTLHDEPDENGSWRWYQCDACGHRSEGTYSEEGAFDNWLSDMPPAPEG